ncbi:MAG: ABC transporter ATP-binding protein [Gammaproteobacteria bacterium]|nr:MAG: ABC transporter ATP-binding protein [Gammaproteobacteria bacterium]
MTALHIDAIHKQFPGVKALNGIDLSVECGEFFGLLGPNGAGKSTLINIIAGLMSADSGTVSIMGHDVKKDFRQARKNLGIVPQELVFDPFLTVRESIRLQAGYYGVGKEGYDWIDEVIDALMLTDKANVNMRALSGGMKRRVLVAQALAHKPPVIVLDEPTAGVDVELRRSLWEFIKRLHGQGHTIILTTHYLEEAEALCDRIGIIDHGKLIALDTTDNLMASGIAAISRLRITIANSPAVLPETLKPLLAKREPNELLFEYDRSKHSVLDIIDALRAADIEIVDINTEHADLEDVFMSLTGRREP